MTPRDVPAPPMRLASRALDGPHDGIELAYADWGDPAAGRTVVCVHGLTRNGRDFDALAAALAARGARVIAVDVAGRGRSSWLDDPRGYALPAYVGQLSRFLELLELGAVDWIGTSMGGVIGMVIAAGDDPPIARLVLNDIGPFVGHAALEMLQSYVGLAPSFDSVAALEVELRKIHSGFGRLTDAQWRHLAEHSARRAPNGWRMHYDPQIRVPYSDVAAEDLDLWPLWDAIRCPTLVLRGADSPVLTADTAAEMRRRGPRPEVVTFPEVGHAPALMAPEQIAAVARWLEL